VVEFLKIEEITGIVIDYGHSSVRAGYSGEDQPKHVFNSQVYY
jgi:actin-related protein